MRCLAHAQMRLQMFCRRGIAGWRLEDGLRFHLENQIAENIVAGIIAEEARLRRCADLSLGTPTSRAFAERDSILGGL
jgi:hypothetical protein